MAEPPFLPQLDTLLTDGRFAEAAALLDEQELLRDDLVMSVAADQAATMASWPHAVHMLSLIAAGRLTDARFLRKRLPPVAAEDAEVQAAWTLLQCLWQNKYAEVWPVMASPAWSPRCSVVVAALTVQVRGKVARLLGKAYSMLGVPTAAACLGISEAEVVDLAQERGWMVEGDGMLRILSEKEPSTHVGTATLQQLTGYVLHLER